MYYQLMAHNTGAETDKEMNQEWKWHRLYILHQLVLLPLYGSSLQT